MKNLKISQTTQLWLLLFFLLATACFSTNRLISSVKGGYRLSLVSGGISVPDQMSGIKAATIRISAEEYHKVEQFHRYMDSLAADPAGKRTHDSIMARHPRLMDSLVQVEQYYKSEFKK